MVDSLLRTRSLGREGLSLDVSSGICRSVYKRVLAEYVIHIARYVEFVLQAVLQTLDRYFKI